MKGKKTIKGKGCYHGFKQGGGKYKEFLFSLPPNCINEEEKEPLMETEDMSFSSSSFNKKSFKVSHDLTKTHFRESKTLVQNTLALSTSSSLTPKKMA